MEKRISVTNEGRDFLLRTFGVTRRMIAYALSFDPVKGQTDLARRIRKLALERGGRVCCTVPMSEVIFDNDGCMRRYFENGMMWEADKATGTFAVRDRHGMVVEVMPCPKLSEMEEVERRIAAM